MHSSNWFTSFDLTQGYLQLTMKEGDIQKTAFRTSSSGLYKFTCMPFGLSNAGSSYCHLMEQCLGDQQFVTLLLYIDDICIFAPSIEEMLDHINLLFNKLKEFHLKIKSKKMSLLWDQCFIPGLCIMIRRNSCKPPKFWIRCKTGQSPQMQEKFIPFWD